MQAVAAESILSELNEVQSHVCTVILIAYEPQCCAAYRVKGHDIFVCDEESHFYSQCLEKLLVKNSSSSQTVIEFGSGDGTPILSCLQRSHFSGTIHGYELNPKSAALARNGAAELQLSQRYVVSNNSMLQ